MLHRRDDKLGYGYKNDIPEMLILAQELQKSGDYKHSREMYMKFFSDNPRHYMRFKALFEVADNLYYEKSYNEAAQSYNNFLKYCDEQSSLTDQERSWINAYKDLAERRLKAIAEKCN